MWGTEQDLLRKTIFNHTNLTECTVDVIKRKRNQRFMDYRDVLFLQMPIALPLHSTKQTNKHYNITLMVEVQKAGEQL